MITNASIRDLHKVTCGVVKAILVSKSIENVAASRKTKRAFTRVSIDLKCIPGFESCFAYDYLSVRFNSEFEAANGNPRFAYRSALHDVDVPVIFRNLPIATVRRTMDSQYDALSRHLIGILSSWCNIGLRLSNSTTIVSFWPDIAINQSNIIKCPVLATFPTRSHKCCQTLSSKSPEPCPGLG